MAKLHINFSALHRCVEQMGAGPVDFTVDIIQKPIDPIDIKLREGLEISLEDISYEGGLLSYEGRQILLYIKDQGRSAINALSGKGTGYRFHVADCQKLNEMRESGRFSRYFVTNDMSGEFEITGVDPKTNQKLSGKVKLGVCRYCLGKLNYKGYVTGNKKIKDDIWKNFSINEFFEHYSSCFKYLPYHSEDDDAQYTKDWAIIAGHTKAQRGFHCEQCGVQLTEHKNLLHVHHINGHKSDNRPDNLQVLCIDCHRKQPMHGHMFVTHEQIKLINRLRRKQGITSNGTWEQALMIADPAVDGVIRLCQSQRLPVPEVSYELQDETGKVVAEVELAWPNYKIAVVLSSKDKTITKKTKWQIWEMIEVLDRTEHFLEQFLR